MSQAKCGDGVVVSVVGRTVDAADQVVDKGNRCLGEMLTTGAVGELFSMVDEAVAVFPVSCIVGLDRASTAWPRWHCLPRTARANGGAPDRPGDAGCIRVVVAV